MIHGRGKPAGKAWSDNAPWHKRSRLRETFSAEFDGAGRSLQVSKRSFGIILEGTELSFDVPSSSLPYLNTRLTFSSQQ